MVTIEETNTVFNNLKNAKQFNLINTKHPIESVNVLELCTIILALTQNLQ